MRKLDRLWIFSALLWGILIVAGVWMGRHGWSFYALSLEERVEHPAFRELRPSGTIGHGYGVVGFGLILTNLLYLARRKLAAFRNFGSMSAWLEIHVFTGLLGALFVAYHSAFQLRTPLVTVTSASLAVVVATGLIGRFLHLIAPRADARPAAEAVAALEARLPGVGRPITLALAEHPPRDAPADASLLVVLARMPGWRRAAHDRREAVELIAHNHAPLGELPRAERREVLRLVRDVRRAAAAEISAVSLGALLRAWRSLHRLFAILMLLTVVVHVAVAWHYGYRWIFE